LISSSHADLKSCTPTCPWPPCKKKQKSWKIYCARSAILPWSINVGRSAAPLLPTPYGWEGWVGLGGGLHTETVVQPRTNRARGRL